jgi:hypothetical protein
MDISGMMQENKSNGPNGQFNTFQSQDPEYNPSGRSSGSSTPGSETDMNMNMNNTNTGFPTQGKWIGGIGWM